MSMMETYAEYLKGPHWHSLKVSLYRSRGKKCEVCCARGKIEAHHLIYRHPLESCTESDLMLLCSHCHELVHRDTALDRFLKSQSDTSSEIRRKIVFAALEKEWGGPKVLARKRAGMERSYDEQRQKIDAQQPLREVKKPFKRWRDYTPDKFTSSPMFA